ncbi:hypothetical protein [Streptomyces coriariae]|uniref:hypothetical protein n=1 Tax=Streptomyces coriariae TaxID=2864460 RepID=UPI001E4499BD|nr:hypothetical protein [Streptomyces coriariae]
MRSLLGLLTAVLSLFLPPRGAHRAPGVPAFPAAYPRLPARRALPYPADVILADGLPLVRPYLAVLERERPGRAQEGRAA